MLCEKSGAADRLQLWIEEGIAADFLTAEYRAEVCPPAFVCTVARFGGAIVQHALNPHDQPCLFHHLACNARLVDFAIFPTATWQDPDGWAVAKCALKEQEFSRVDYRGLVAGVSKCRQGAGAVAGMCVM